MKTHQKYALALSLFTFSAQADSLGATEILQLPLTKVFIAAQGFDDNDHVQAVAFGTLPNACYRPSTAEVTQDKFTGEFLVIQNVFRDTTGLCQNPANLPEDLAQPRFFSKEIDLGQLAVGNYLIRYNTLDGDKERFFSISPALADSVDTLRYPIITNAFVSDKVSASDQTFEIRIQGYLTSSCSDISDNSKVVAIDDVFVVLLETNRKDSMCLPINEPFYKVFQAKVPTAGSYLLHVRSLSGEARNKVFQVK
jgi:hypothetical protein